MSAFCERTPEPAPARASGTSGPAAGVDGASALARRGLRLARTRARWRGLLGGPTSPALRTGGRLGGRGGRRGRSSRRKRQQIETGHARAPQQEQTQDPDDRADLSLDTCPAETRRRRAPRRRRPLRHRRRGHSVGVAARVAVLTRRKNRSPITRPPTNSEPTASTCSAVLAVFLILKPRPSSTRTVSSKPKMTSRPGRTRMNHSKTVKGTERNPASAPRAKTPSRGAVSSAPLARPVKALPSRESLMARGSAPERRFLCAQPLAVRPL